MQSRPYFIQLGLTLLVISGLKLRHAPQVAGGQMIVGAGRDYVVHVVTGVMLCWNGWLVSPLQTVTLVSDLRETLQQLKLFLILVCTIK